MCVLSCPYRHTTLTLTHLCVHLHDKLLMHWRNGPKWIYFYFSLMRRFVKKLLQALTLDWTKQKMNALQERKCREAPHHIIYTYWMLLWAQSFFSLHFLAATVHVPCSLCCVRVFSFFLCDFILLLCTVYSLYRINCCSCIHSFSCIFPHLFRQLIFFFAHSHFQFIPNRFRFNRFYSTNPDACESIYSLPCYTFTSIWRS